MPGCLRRAVCRLTHRPHHSPPVWTADVHLGTRCAMTRYCGRCGSTIRTWVGTAAA